jgi:hypothetical protein
MTVVVAVVSLAVFLIAAAVVAWPIVRGDRVSDQDEAAAVSDLQRVDDDLQRTLSSIKEIAFDHASGHLSDDDFSTLDADERAKAIELMRQRDELAAEPAGEDASTV